MVWIAGLYYNVADCFRLLSFAALFRKRYMLASALMIASFLTHPIYAVIGCVFVVSSQLCILKTLIRDDFIKIIYGISVFSIFVLLWYVYVMGNGMSAGLKIPQKEWMHWSVINNFHWFPIEYGLFGGLYHERLLGFMSIILLYLYSIICKENITSIDRQIFYGMLGLVLLVVLGIAFSGSSQIPRSSSYR